MNVLENKEEKISKMDDYVFISYMKGNDFIEPIIMCHNEELMLNCYQKLGKPIIVNGEIDEEAFMGYIKLMADREEEELCRIRRQRELESKRCDMKIENLPKKIRRKELEMREGEEGYKERYEKLMEKEEGYKRHMKWIKEYNEGKEVKRRRKRGRIGPMMKGLMEGEGSSSSEEEMDEKDQLVYVLPKEDKEILEEKGIRGINEGIYEEEREYEWDYKNQLWESKIRMKRIRKRGRKEGEENLYV
jgi:hypothetical protein